VPAQWRSPADVTARAQGDARDSGRDGGRRPCAPRLRGESRWACLSSFAGDAVVRSRGDGSIGVIRSNEARWLRSSLVGCLQ
jgi:hypothetical protein